MPPWRPRLWPPRRVLASFEDGSHSIPLRLRVNISVAWPRAFRFPVSIHIAANFGALWRLQCENLR